MASLDLNLFRKIVGRFGSSHEPEVLIAVRKAQEMLKEAGLTWDDVLVGPAASSSQGSAAHEGARPQAPGGFSGAHAGGFSQAAREASRPADEANRKSEYDTVPTHRRYEVFQRMSDAEVWRRLMLMPLPPDQIVRLEKMRQAVFENRLDAADVKWIRMVFRTREFMM